MAKLLSDVIDGLNNCIIRARVVRTWNAVNFKTGQVFSRDMLLLDEQGIAIHAQIPERMMTRMEKKFVDGQIVTIQYFTVCPAGVSHRPVANNKKIIFLRNTIVRPQSESSKLPAIPTWFFDFVEEDVIFSRKDNHYVLTDVIGLVQRVGAARQVTANGTDISVRDVSIKLQGGSVFNLTLWDKFSSLLNEDDLTCLEQPVIIAVAAVSVTTYQGNWTLKTNSCSQVFINPKISEANALRTRFQSEGPIEFSCLTSEPIKDDAIRAHENRKTLAEIHALEWSPDFKDETYTILARIKSINATSGWAYSACATCSSKVSYQGGKQFCKKCNKPIIDAAYRYKVHAMVLDETSEGEITMFDRQMIRLIKIPAAQLITEENAKDMEIPVQIQNLCNKTFIFEIKVTDRNLMHGWNSYTVTRVFENVSAEAVVGGNTGISLQSNFIPTQIEKGKKRRFISRVSDDEDDDITQQKLAQLKSKRIQVNKEKNEDGTDQC